MKAKSVGSDLPCLQLRANTCCFGLLEKVTGFHISAALERVEYGFSDRLRQPDSLIEDFFFKRLTALRPYFAAGLPLSCAIAYARISIASSSLTTATNAIIKQYLSKFVNLSSGDAKFNVFT